MFGTCRKCKEPIMFVVLVGWTHLSTQGFDHEAVA